MRELNRVRLVALLGAVATSLGGCNPWNGTYGPGPDSLITVSSIGNAEFSAQPLIECLGPPDEVAQLGGLCSITSPRQVASRRVASGSFALIADDRATSGYVVAMFGYQDRSVSPSVVSFAAVMMPSPPPSLSVASDEWNRSVYGDFRRGEPMHGTIGVQSFSTIDPWDSDAFIGTADLRWRNTTIRFRFDAGYVC